MALVNQGDTSGPNPNIEPTKAELDSIKLKERFLLMLERTLKATYSTSYLEEMSEDKSASFFNYGDTRNLFTRLKPGMTVDDQGVKFFTTSDHISQTISDMLNGVGLKKEQDFLASDDSPVGKKTADGNKFIYVYFDALKDDQLLDRVQAYIDQLDTPSKGDSASGAQRAIGMPIIEHTRHSDNYRKKRDHHRLNVERGL